MKNLFWLLLLFFAGGCLVFTEDPRADQAAKKYWQIKHLQTEKKIPLSRALEMVKAAERVKIRRLFALYLNSKHSGHPLTAEISRIDLNTALGFLPEIRIQYTGDPFAGCPEEIPPVETTEKTAMIIDNGKTPLPELLAKIRRHHADVVAAMNLKEREKRESDRLFYLLKCLALADAIGVDLPDLNDLSEYEKRFDAAAERWQKALKNMK